MQNEQAVFPQELAEIIICSVDQSSLPSCALVCRSWVFQSRSLQLGNENFVLKTVWVPFFDRVHGLEYQSSLLELLASPYETLSPHIRQLEIENWEHWVAIARQWHQTRFPALVRLSIRIIGFEVIVPRYTKPFKQATDLQILEHLEGFPSNAKQVLVLLAHFPNLERLTFHPLLQVLGENLHNTKPAFPVYEKLQAVSFSLYQTGLITTFLPSPNFPHITRLGLTRLVIIHGNPAFAYCVNLIKSLGPQLTWLHVDLEVPNFRSLDMIPENTRDTNLSRLLGSHNFKLERLEIDLPDTALAWGISFICTGLVTSSFSRIESFDLNVRRSTRHEHEECLTQLSAFLSDLRSSDKLGSVKINVESEIDRDLFQDVALGSSVSINMVKQSFRH